MAGCGLSRCCVSDMRCGVADVQWWLAAGSGVATGQPGEERACRRRSQGECRVCVGGGRGQRILQSVMVWG
jgi:hypothetical protein